MDTTTQLNNIYLCKKMNEWRVERKTSYHPLANWRFIAHLISECEVLRYKYLERLGTHPEFRSASSYNIVPSENFGLAKMTSRSFVFVSRPTPVQL